MKRKLAGGAALAGPFAYVPNEKSGTISILDTASDEVIGPKIDERGEIRPLATTARFVRNPAALLGVPRMIRNLRISTDAIADALEEIIARRSGASASNQ